MSKKRAFVRYSKQGKIVPGSLILTGGSYPNGPSTWKEVPADLCCDGGGCSSVAITVQLRYSVIECVGVSSPADYIILCCNGNLTINTPGQPATPSQPAIPPQPVPDGYYYSNTNDGVISYIVENSIVVGAGSVCP